MSLAALTLILVAGLTGPALASWRALGVPVAVGELLAGVALGPSGADVLPQHDETLTLLTTVGFALVMLVAGSHLDARALSDRATLRAAIVAVAVTAAAAVILAPIISAISGYHHTALYALLLTSSSAAIVLPVVERLGPAVDTRMLVAAVTIADVACIVLLPVVMRSGSALQTAAVASCIAAAAGCVFAVLRRAQAAGTLDQLREVSKERRLGLELRISLIIVLGLAAFASRFHVTVMIAGFSVGLAIAAVGLPHRLARQLFATNEGFFAPIFFVMLGATIDLRQLAAHPRGIALAIALGAGIVAAHAAARLAGLPARQAVMSGAQLGVPIAAVTIGRGTGALSDVESSAILAAALASIVITTLAARGREGAPHEQRILDAGA